MAQRRGGIIQVAVDGVVHDCKGEYSYNLGRPKREAVVGEDRIHGYFETPQVGFIEGAITDRGDLDVEALVGLTGVTVTLTLANGKVIALSDAWYAADGTGTTKEGQFELRFEGNCEEVPA